MEEQSLESAKETKTDDKKLVKRWLSEKTLADKREKQWRKDAECAIDVYRNEVSDSDGERKEMFNIFWANVETKRSNLYENTPRPDIRRRFKDKNKLAASISEVLERASSFTFEASELDFYMTQAVEDMLTAGRAITRVKYKPTLVTNEVETEEGMESVESLDFEEVEYEQVQYDKFRMGPCSNWSECPWILFIHDMTKDQAEEMFGDIEDISFSGEEHLDKDKDKSKKSDDEEVELFKTAPIYEFWVKDSREVLWIAPTKPDKKLLKKDADPLGLAEFWPIPRPLYAIRSSTSTVPRTEHSMYETLQRELETATKRLRNIINGLKVRGIYDSRIGDLEKVLEEDDNGFVPSSGTEVVAETGLDKAIWMLPIDKIITIANELRQFRADLIQQIYEITGISDILRGSSNPHETLGAQRIKAQFGSKRFREQQKEVQRYCRDLLRLTVELICEFEPETLSLMTGLDFPTAEMKADAQMQMQSGMVPDEHKPKLMNILENPSWDEMLEVMRSDMRREYMVDIETNSTIEIDETEDRENVNQLFTAIVQFMQAAKGSGFPPEVQNALLGAILRRFKFGREVEDALDDMINNPQPDPAGQEAQMDGQMKQMDMKMKEMDMQVAQEKAQAAQAKAQADLAKANAEAEQTRMDMEFSQQEHLQRMRELQMGVPNA